MISTTTSSVLPVIFQGNIPNIPSEICSGCPSGICSGIALGNPIKNSSSLVIPAGIPPESCYISFNNSGRYFSMYLPKIVKSIFYACFQTLISAFLLVLEFVHRFLQDFFFRKSSKHFIKVFL